jgi:AraC-like DNA-binding protein
MKKIAECKNCYAINKCWTLIVCAFCESAVRQRYSKIVRTCCDYISTQLHEKITLTQLSELTKQSPRYLSMLFKNEMGQSISAYIQMEKINEAKKLLTFSNYSIAEISAYLNFSSQSYFSTSFLKITKMTPLNYRYNYGKRVGRDKTNYGNGQEMIIGATSD